MSEYTCKRCHQQFDTIEEISNSECPKAPLIGSRRRHFVGPAWSKLSAVEGDASDADEDGRDGS